MHQKIHKLSPYISSLIAAGEVIRRPEDIVRELIDNSIDAGATQIDISIEQGGLGKIKIQDNGEGISENDLALALMHHATSKIKQIEDIEQLHTLGFRGEALASIAAVSRLEISSRVKDSLHGFTITSKPNEKAASPKPVAHPVGTTLTITELFHQVPARRHFLRTPATEFSRIHQWVKYLSLSHVNIAFSLKHNERYVLKFTSLNTEDARLTRLATLYNTDFVKSATFFTHEDEHCTLTGWISSADFSRSQADWQCFYINSRLIKNKSLSHAVKTAYQNTLYRDRQPAFVLFITLDPKSVDVNVHPTKAEIRFHQPQQVYHFVYKTVQNVLAKTPLTHFSVAQKTFSPESKVLEENAFKPLEADAIVNDRPNNRLNDLSDSRTEVTSKTLFQPNPTQSLFTHQSKELPPFDDLGNALFQLHSIYILAQNDKGLVIVDAHAAHERVLYEALKESFEKEKPHIQQLLIPLTFSLTEEESELLKTHHLLFEKMGFKYVETAKKLTLQTVPHVLANISFQDLIHDVLSDLKKHNLSMQLQEKCNRLFSTIACRSATQANRTMSLYEMNQLLRKMETTPHSGQCVHGRPTHRLITLNELNSWFLRGR